MATLGRYAVRHFRDEKLILLALGLAGAAASRARFQRTRSASVLS